MNTVVLGVSIVVVGLSAWVYPHISSLRIWLDSQLGVNRINAAGYLGGAMQLGAVVALSRGWFANTSTTYHALSLIGSSGLLITSFYHGAMAPVLVNAIWMGMNTVGIIEGVSNLQALREITGLVV